MALADDIGGVKVLIKNINDIFLEELTVDTIKTLIQAILSKIEARNQKAFIFFTLESDSKVLFLSAASEDLVKEKNSIYNASNRVKEAAKICGGGGGGRPNFAQAGGKDPSKIPEVLSRLLEDLKAPL